MSHTQQPTSEEFKQHVKNTGTWKRLLMMLIFCIIYSVSEIVLAAVVILQFLSIPFTGNKNDKLLSLGASLSSYTYQIFSYLTFNSEKQPYPIGEWPSDKPLVEQQEVIAAADSEEQSAGTEF